jgi:acyl carrier protein
MNPVYDLIAERLVSYFGVPAELVRPEATMEDLEVDSLMLAEIAVIIEDEHGFRVEDAVVDATVTMTLGEVAERLDRARLRAASGGSGEPPGEPVQVPESAS